MADLKSFKAEKYLEKMGIGKEHHYFWKQVGKALLCTYAVLGAWWLYNNKETSPLGWTAKPRPEEEKKMHDKKFEQEALKIWSRMKKEAVSELQSKGVDVE